MITRIVLLILIVFVHSDARACFRCGRKVCRFVPPVTVTPSAPPAASQVVVPPQPSSTIVFQYDSAAPLSGLLGSTSYGAPPSFKNLAAAYQFNPQAVLAEAAALVDQAQNMAGAGLAGYLETVQSTTQNATGAIKLALAAEILRAADQLQESPVTQSQTLTLRLNDGRWQVEQLPADPGAAGSKKVGTSSLLRTACFECHSGSDPDGGVRFDAPIAPDLFVRAARAMAAGRMPKEREPLNAAQQLMVWGELPVVEEEE